MARVRPGILIVAAALAASAILAPAPAALAQDSPAEQPASIVAGSCASLGTTPAFSLRTVTPNDPRIGGSFSGQPTAMGVLTSETDVRVSLSTLLKSPHAIVIGDLAAPVACGDIGGFTRGIVNNDEIEIGLSPLGESGHFGIARIEGDGNETEIDLFVAAPARA